MYPESPFAHSRGSFMTPQNIPTAGPSDTPHYPICINEQWLPLIAGCLKQLLLQTSWDFPTSAALLNVQGNVFNLIDLFNLSQLTEGDCVPIEFRQPDICTLEVSFDSGAHWSQIFNAETCVLNGANQAILDALNGGEISPGFQQPPLGSTPLPAQCYDYDIAIDSTGQWRSPVPVEADDVITITLVRGGWWDGDVLNFWYCPDGGEYALGICNPGGLVMDPTDPLPTAFHMRLVANIPSATIPWLDAYNTSITVASGTPAGELALQANDAMLSDNQGTIQLHVQICKGGFFHHFDFTTGQHGWAILSGGDGVYTAGVGFQSFAVPTTFVEVDMDITFASRHLDVVDIHYHWQQIIAGDGTNELVATVAGVNTNVVSRAGDTSTGDYILSMTAPHDDVTRLIPELNEGNVVHPTAGRITVFAIDVRGKGSDPF